MTRAFFDGRWHDVDLVDVECVNDEVYRFKLRENDEVFFIEASKVEAWW